jgi:sec-independent protein translocase protein TatA
MTPLIGVPNGWELVLIVAVIVMLFGARKLPELARGTGQALRIFKSETKGLVSDVDDDPPTKREIQPGQSDVTTRSEDILREQRGDTTT